MAQPNILFVMTDQQRYDTIAALGNPHIYTPNFDRLVRRGVAFTNAYTSCPVCVAARYGIMTGCEPPTTRSFSNGPISPAAGQPATITERCGAYLPQTMRQRGYRTFGVGKFHTRPWNEDLGFDVQLHSEEIYEAPNQRPGDAYAAWLAKEHPAFAFIEQPHGERTEMYYMPQMSPLPAALTVEAWAAARAVELINVADPRPWFGFVSFIGPHPPLAPPIPFNRMYDPDRMPNPVRGARRTDHADELVRWMNHAVWADDITHAHARVLRARYYGEISYIDHCLGKILDALEARPDADNTLICFFADHGDHMGDHRAWQKESFFEQAAHIPFLLSWPTRVPRAVRRDALVSLTDLFGIATHAAGRADTRDGIDLLAMLHGSAPARDVLFGTYGAPGSTQFKIMVRDPRWKYIFLANGGRELLFDVAADPCELKDRAKDKPGVLQRLRRRAIAYLQQPGTRDALAAGTLKQFRYKPMDQMRIVQMDQSHGIKGFPAKPEDALLQFYGTVDPLGS